VSDTPRTDAEQILQAGHVTSDFARQLERELNKATAEAETAKASRNRAGMEARNELLPKLGLVAQERDEWRKCAEKAEADLKEERLRAEINQKNNVLAMEELARQAEKAEAACAAMREALETVASYPVARSYPDGPCLDSSDMAEVKEALSTSCDSRYVPIEDVKPLLEFAEQMHRIDGVPIPQADTFLAKHGDKPK
jgi:hypothetical protein